MTIYMGGKLIFWAYVDLRDVARCCRLALRRIFRELKILWLLRQMSVFSFQSLAAGGGLPRCPSS